jgi:hypothetical protein
MLTGQYRRIYHFHLRKCGGSTLNHWLDTLTFDGRTFDAQTWRSFSVADATSSVGVAEMIIPSLAAAAFHWSDVVYTHDPIRIYAPEDTFCLTVLRDPVRRLVSQVADWRRLNAADLTRSPPWVRACVEDSWRLSLRELLEKHGKQGGHRFLDNHMTRCLANGRAGNVIDDDAEVERLIEPALQTLEMDYDLVGLTEHMDLGRNALCAMVGLPPARQVPAINATRAAGDSDQELHDATDIVEELTFIDRVIYDRACALFDERHRRTAEAYTIAMFESGHAAELLDEARGVVCEGATRYSVRGPIVGSGFHGRDGGGLASCAVWSGPASSTTLYIPAPPHMKLSLLVWIRGYADVRQRGQLRVRVDGEPAAHVFEYADGYADILIVDARSVGTFMRLEIDLDETLASGTPGSDHHDPRLRGFAFDSYGWRPLL